MKSHRPTSKRSVIWRGDLVRTRLFQAAYSDDRQDVLPLIDSLGFVAESIDDRLESSRSAIEKMIREIDEYERNRPKLPIEVKAIEQIPVTPAFHWVPTLFRLPVWKARSQDPEPEDLDSNDHQTGTPVVCVPQPLLATWPQLRSRLQPLLSRSVITRKIDEKKLVLRLCRCESISKLPRIVRKRSPEQVHVIADRSDRCIPFFTDQQLVAKQLAQDLARDQCRFSVGRLPNMLDKSSPKLRTRLRSGWDEGLDDDRTEEPDPQSTVLILGDLAVLERHKPHERAAWVRSCRRWRLRGVKIYALVPYSTDQLPRELSELVEPIAWQGNAIEYASDLRREELLRAIFVRTYPAMQLEPGLLRELRTMVPDALDASLESDIWQHDWLASNHVTAARNDRVDVKERLQAEFERLDSEIRRMVLSTQRRFRQSTGHRSLWQLEFLNQTLETRALLDEYEQDTAAMRRTLREYQEYVLRDAIPDDKHDQIVWYSRRTSEAALNDPLIGDSVRLLQRTFQQSEPWHPATTMEELKTDGIQRLVRLIPGEERLGAERFRSSGNAFAGGGNSVVIEGTCRGLALQVPELDTKTRRERAFWKSGKKPDWVSDYGTDEYGAWCEFQVPRHDGKGMVTQRMRWIKPGQFMMGSPENEADRNKNETLHRVKLTRGYWLADTPVTQELWKAINDGKNPSEFHGEKNPVENVSWLLCQSWIGKLCDLLRSSEFSLPTEAQWEFSCRSGFQTAYCFGNDPTYLPDYGWFGENSAVGVCPVKMLKANQSGLYDMHGNVWEWCSDWYEDFGSTEQTDPVGPEFGDARVIRGGSWFNPARSIRSACRIAQNPQNNSTSLGFRLLSSAQGAEPSERVMLPVAEQGTEPASSIQVRVKDKEPSRSDSFWKSGAKPQWVSDYGRDNFGLWCEFQVPRYDNKGLVTQRMRWIKPGTFLMGSTGEEKKLEIWDETQHEVTLTQGYWLADTQVTQELWRSIGVENPRRFRFDSHPVKWISWSDCQEWLRKISKSIPTLELTLPTEAQWEYACRAGSTTAYCFGDDPKELPKYGWFDGNSKSTTHPVKQLQPNDWGLYDMHGNVWEWCSDWFDVYRKSATSDPAGPVKSTVRVIRGGCWLYPPRSLRSACRVGRDPGFRYDYLGFRLLSSAQAAEPSEGAMLPVAEQGTERVRIGSAQPAYEFLRSVDLDATGENSPEEEFAEIDINAYTSIRVVSDQEGYQFDRLEKPTWAVEFGSDSYGLHATFEVLTARQRMRWIPPGRFLMGSPDGKDYERGNEYPQHEVIISHGYWMFDTCCTQELWAVLMGKNPSYFPDPKCPVEQVSWQNAVEFARKLNERMSEGYPKDGRKLVDGWDRLMFRLPTEAEWEYACRAGTTADTYAGDLKILGDANAPLLDSIAWYGGNSGHEYDLKEFHLLDREWLKLRQYPEKKGGTRNAGLKKPNSFGLFDMIGNVWEWCQDWYGAYPTELTEPMVDPTGPEEGTFHVFRGGSWDSPAGNLRSASRSRLAPHGQAEYLGFRLLSSAHQADQATELP